MSENRRLLDRMFQLAAPGVDVDHRPPPARLADGVWSLERHLRMTGGPILPSRTTLVRSSAGGLTVISPPPPHDETFAAIDALGKVEALVAPNSFHYLYVNDAKRRYPEAELYLAPGLQDRVATLPPGLDFSMSSPSPELERVSLGPVRGMSEVIIFHRPSRILILSDLAFNLIHIERALDRVFWRAFGVPPEFGPSRTASLMLLKDRSVSKPALRRVLDWPFERILVAHGDVVQTEARARFQRAFASYL